MDTDRNPKPVLTNEFASEEGPGGIERKRRNVETIRNASLLQKIHRTVAQDTERKGKGQENISGISGW